MPISSPNLQTLAQIMANLRSLTPLAAPEFFKTRQQSGETLTYIPWYKAKEALDRHAPGWDYAIKDVGSVTGDLPEVRDYQGNIKKNAQPGFTRVYVVAVIMIPTSEGIVTRMATGFEDFAVSGYGDPFSNASAMALGRAAALFDLGIDLYDKDKRASIGAGVPQGQQQNNYPQQGQGQPQQQQNDGILKAKHGSFKGVPLTDVSIELGWLNYMCSPKAEFVSAPDKAMYAAEVARRQSGGTPGGAQVVTSSPPAQYQPPQQSHVQTMPQGIVQQTVPQQPHLIQQPQASTTSGPRSNDDIKMLFEIAKAVGQSWEAVQARSVNEFGREPKLLSSGEFGTLQLMIAKNKAKNDFLALAAQHLSGNIDPNTWGQNELSLLAAMA